MSNRSSAFEKAQQLVDNEKVDEALAEISEFTSEDGVEYSISEMRIINTIISEKLTSASFEEKKDACFACLDLIEGVKITKNAEWLELYNDSIYEIFSKLNRCARDEERNEVWNRLKELFYEVTLAAKKVWKEKNAPGGLEIYVYYAKLVKSYLDVADEDSFKICETFAKEAKFVGKGTLDDDDYKDAKKSIELINKTVGDAKHERDLLDDE
ncbi:unnamed protein product [Caenorhabditis angaria]|uniref:DUF7758 domain-containing protein n=1 Tax=Caenorhabditis angaria TaxID=860376 RepID=A0A9P1N9J9_9PELO|nr:unnamed protein product [Caenorhabditis angaria]